jgi:CBS domain-containing protein
MLVADLMKLKSARVPSIRMNETVEMAATLLNRERIGAVVVKDACGSEGDTVVGIFSERDVVKAIAGQGVAALKQPVSALMSRNMISCTMEDTVDHVRALMDSHHVRHLPVLQEHQLVGVLSIRDVLSYDVRRAQEFEGLARPTGTAMASAELPLPA